MRTIAATGEILLEETNIRELSIRTRVPTKYLLVDMETNQIYRGSTEDLAWKKQKLDPKPVIQFINSILDLETEDK